MPEIDYAQVEDAARELYIRALKRLPDDIKQGFAQLRAAESSPRAQTILDTMTTNITVAEQNDNLLCQDTGIPIYNVLVGRRVGLGGWRLKQPILAGCERDTREHPLRSSVVHPISRKNVHTSYGPGVPVIHIDFCEQDDRREI